MIESNPTLYSVTEKFTKEFGTVRPREGFILTGRGSNSTSNNLRYYWRLVRGISPAIYAVEEDGMTIKFIAPPKETEIEFELKVKDLETEEEATKNITVKVSE